MNELTLDEMLRLAAKVEKWDKHSYGYRGNIDDIQVIVRGAPGIFTSKTVDAGITIESGDIEFADVSNSKNPDLIELYDHAKKSYEERCKKEREEAKKNVYTKIRELIK